MNDGMPLRLTAAIALLLGALAAPAAADDVLRVSAPHALVPLITSLAENYATAQALKVDVSERSSNAAAAALKAGDVDVAVSDSALAETGYADTPIAAVPFAVIVNPAVGVEALGSERIKALFEHRSTWREAGGNDVPLFTVERPRGSASERLVDAVFSLAPDRRAAEAIEDASASVVRTVRESRGAIGVIGLPFAGDLTGVTVLKAGPALIAYEHAVTFGAPSLRVSRFVAFLRTQSATWRTAGFIPMRDAR